MPASACRSAEVKVVFHADDCWLTAGVNGGIVEAYQRGARSTSLMVTAPAFKTRWPVRRRRPASTWVCT
jgi:predicted glycoside hydrolase/deacetylase ChbG (UPF0249 family)